MRDAIALLASHGRGPSPGLPTMDSDRSVEIRSIQGLEPAYPGAA
ncbi:hypothetical protein [Leptolyngbya sp. CCY15150]|nr:hypothetical protein [Leptolyngbya sp. CCY15150]